VSSPTASKVLIRNHTRILTGLIGPTGKSRDVGGSCHVGPSHLKTREAELRSFDHRLIAVPSLHDAAGHVFERLVHDYYQQARCFGLDQALEPNDRLLNSTTFDLESSEEFRSQLSELYNELLNISPTISRRAITMQRNYTNPGRPVFSLPAIAFPPLRTGWAGYSGQGADF
jgi:hypothetical protein